MMRLLAFRAIPASAAEAIVSEHQEQPSANGYADDHVLDSSH
jgi:hypothetical protein